MIDITAKPFDWNDNLSKEAIEDFEGIQKDLPYCTCQNIGMALAKLEQLEKQGCKVIDPSGSSSEKPNKCENAISRQAAIDVIFSEPLYKSGMKKRNADEVVPAIYRKIKSLPPVNPKEETVTEFADRCRECGKMKRCRDCKYFEYNSVAKVDGIPLIVAHEICSKWGDGCKTSEDGYCFLFEPKKGSKE